MVSILQFTLLALVFFKALFMAGSAFAHESLRPLTTDRPDLTESPFTVDFGHIQVESTLIGFSRSRQDAAGSREDAFEFATTNVRLGLTENVELNVAVQPFGIVRTRSKSIARQKTEKGVGSLQIRGKVNLFGNDRFENVGDTALAILPFVTIPTDRDNGISVGDVEGGIIVPFAVVLPNNFGLGLNAGVSMIGDDNAGYDTEYFISAALSYEWSNRFGTYYEIAAALNADSSESDNVLVGTGFTYSVDDNTQLDGGVNFGLTDAADQWAPFIGVTRRF